MRDDMKVVNAIKILVKYTKLISRWLFFLLLATSTDIQEKSRVFKSTWFWELFSKVSVCYCQLDLSSI